MTTISKDARGVTLNNLLTQVTERSVRKAAGFLSFALHRTLDLQQAHAIAKFEPGRPEVAEISLPGDRE